MIDIYWLVIGYVFGVVGSYVAVVGYDKISAYYRNKGEEAARALEMKELFDE